MKLTTVKRKNVTHYYVSESRRTGDKVSTKIVKKLGTDKEIMDRYKVDDPHAWAKQQIDDINNKNKNKNKNKINQKQKKDYERDVASFKGVQVVSDLFDRTGITNFCHYLEKKKNLEKNYVYEVVLLLVLDKLYFPYIEHTVFTYFNETFFKPKKYSAKDLAVVLPLLVKNIDLLLETLSKNNDYTAYKNLSFLTSLKTSNILKGAACSEIGIIYDAYAVPIGLLHELFGEETNKKSLKLAANLLNFADLYTSADITKLSDAWPENLEIKHFRKINYKQAKSLTKKSVFYNDSWQNFNFQREQEVKRKGGFYSVSYKEFSLAERPSYKVVAFYGDYFKQCDYNNYTKMTAAIENNPQCVEDDIANIKAYLKTYAYNKSTIGYRFYFVPKKMDPELLITSEYRLGISINMMSSTGYQLEDAALDASKQDIFVGSQITSYLAILVRALFIKETGYYVSGEIQTSLFLQNLDAADFSDALNKYINNVLFRADID